MNNFCLFKSLYEKHGTLGTVSNICCRNTNNNKIKPFFGNRMQIEAFWKQSQTLAGIVWSKMDTKHGTFRTIWDTCCKNWTITRRKIILCRFEVLWKKIADTCYSISYFALHTVWPFQINIRHLLQKINNSNKNHSMQIVVLLERSLTPDTGFYQPVVWTYM